jgi:hypothetical protein
MADTGGAKQRQKPKDKGNPSLSEIAHKQVMDLLRQAEKSQHPDIISTALKIAEETSKHQRSQTARVPPILIVFLAVVITAVAGRVCLLCFRSYTLAVASEISAIVLLLYLTLIVVLLFLAGRLTERSLMKVLSWVRDHVKGLFSRSKPRGDTPSDNN